MKNLALLFAILAVGLTGCVVISKTESVMVQPGSAEAALCAEIDAAGKLNFDSSQTSALNAIAKRNSLSPTAQMHLVNTVLRRLRYDHSRMTVLQTLIANPSFCNAAKQHLLVNLSRLSFDSSKRSLLRSLDGRGDLKC